MRQGIWRYAPDRASSYLLRDITKAKMSHFAIAKLQSAMERVELGTSHPGEQSRVLGELFELRVNADKRWYRVLFGRYKGDFIALSLVIKKSNRLEQQDIETANRRLRAYTDTA